jgi:hypothetical protein
MQCLNTYERKSPVMNHKVSNRHGTKKRPTFSYIANSDRRAKERACLPLLFRNSLLTPPLCLSNVDRAQRALHVTICLIVVVSLGQLLQLDDPHVGLHAARPQAALTPGSHRRVVSKSFHFVLQLTSFMCSARLPMYLLA